MLPSSVLPVMVVQCLTNPMDPSKIEVQYVWYRIRSARRSANCSVDGAYNSVDYGVIMELEQCKRISVRQLANSEGLVTNATKHCLLDPAAGVAAGNRQRVCVTKCVVHIQEKIVLLTVRLRAP